MVPTLLVDAATDPTLQHRDIRVLVVLAAQLTDRFAPLKHLWLARQTDLPRTSVVKSLRSLIGRGYVDEGPRGCHSRTYRLNVPRVPGKVAA